MAAPEWWKWRRGDVLEYHGWNPDYRCDLVFKSLDPEDPYGFYAYELDDPHRRVSRCWTRTRFRRREKA